MKVLVDEMGIERYVMYKFLLNNNWLLKYITFLLRNSIFVMHVFNFI